MTDEDFLDDMRARINPAYADHIGTESWERRRALEIIDRLTGEVEALRQDAVRLDWLADPANTVGQVLLPTPCVEANLGSLRGAIDAAMAQGQEELDHG